MHCRQCRLYTLCDYLLFVGETLLSVPSSHDDECDPNSCWITAGNPTGAHDERWNESNINKAYGLHEQAKRTEPSRTKNERCGWKSACRNHANSSESCVKFIFSASIVKTGITNVPLWLCLCLCGYWCACACVSVYWREYTFYCMCNPVLTHSRKLCVYTHIQSIRMTRWNKPISRNVYSIRFEYLKLNEW